MHRLHLIVLVVFLFSKPTLATPGTPAPEEGSSRPNIILAMADDQGWGDMAYNGHPFLKTPVFDEMARTALRFDRFYAAAPVCSPTRGSVLTGRHPVRFGCFAWGRTLRPQEITVAEALRKAGYTTGHFGKWHLGSLRADSPVCPGNSGFDEWVSSPNFYENNPLFCHNGKVIETKGESSEVTVDAALNWIGKVSGGDKPFLAVVWFGNPHLPHIATKKYLEMYPGQTKAQANFCGEITAMDAAMGKLRKGLRKLEIAENTILWYCSDNGALKQGSTGGLSGRKGSLLEGGIRVPAIIEWPAKIRKPRRTSVPCNTSDILPTLLEIAGVTLDKPPPLDGISIAALLSGEMKSREKPMGFWAFPERGRGKKSRLMLQELRAEQKAGQQKPAPAEGRIEKQYPLNSFPGPAAWIDGDYKLMTGAKKKGAKGRFSLFNLAKDAAEKKDLSEKHPEKVKAMRAGLKAWQKSVLNSLNGKDYSP